MLRYFNDIGRSRRLPDSDPPLTPFLRGTICKLADRPCPLDGPRGLSTVLPLLSTSSAPTSLGPIEMIEIERLCACPSLATFGAPVVHELGLGCGLAEAAGVLNDNVVRWPLVVGVPRELIAELLFLGGTGIFRCLSGRSGTGMKPLADCGCKEALECVGALAIFLKVI